MVSQIHFHVSVSTWVNSQPRTCPLKIRSVAISAASPAPQHPQHLSTNLHVHYEQPGCFTTRHILPPPLWRLFFLLGLLIFFLSLASAQLQEEIPKLWLFHFMFVFIVVYNVQCHFSACWNGLRCCQHLSASNENRETFAVKTHLSCIGWI